MAFPDKLDSYADTIKPHRAKFLIVALMGLLGVLFFFVIPMSRSEAPNNITVVVISYIILFWGFGLLMFTFHHGHRKQGVIARHIPTFRAMGRWYSSVFYVLWFSMLSIFTLVAPFMVILSKS